MLKIRRPLGRLIFNMGIAIPGKTVFLIETAPRAPLNINISSCQYIDSLISIVYVWLYLEQSTLNCLMLMTGNYLEKYGLSKGHSFEFIRITDIAKSNYQYRQMIYRYRYLIIFIDIGKWLTAIGNLIHRYQKIFKSNFTQLKALRVFYRRLHVTESTLRTVSNNLWERSSTQKHNYENIFWKKKVLFNLTYQKRKS